MPNSEALDSDRVNHIEQDMVSPKFVALSPRKEHNEIKNNIMKSWWAISKRYLHYEVSRIS